MPPSSGSVKPSSPRGPNRPRSTPAAGPGGQSGSGKCGAAGKYLSFRGRSAQSGTKSAGSIGTRPRHSTADAYARA